MKEIFMRASGILLPMFSLPSKYGIGCMSKEAYHFIDILKEAGQKKWQLLPIGPTGYGDSPYQSFSTYAGNPYFIDLETLISEGFLSKKECEAFQFGEDDTRVDYGTIYHSRFRILRIAHKRFQETEAYHQFLRDHGWWLDDFSLFMALKHKYDGASWHEWDVPHRMRFHDALQQVGEELQEEIRFTCWLQFEFRRQWDRLHAYAKKQGIDLIGDLPIYVAEDSADSWAQPRLFQFNEHNEAIAVAGCPPDYFSPTGQLWGNPLYSWEYHRETNYDWWITRISYTFTIFDIVRIDHFRGFDEYYSIPAGRDDATIGEWKKGPGMELFHTIKARLGDLNIIAEDLGLLTDSVMQLLKDSGFPGMKVLQFAFDSKEENDYLPHTYERNSIVYTGTHDNDTTVGWFRKADKPTRKFMENYMGGTITRHDVAWRFIRLAMSSVSNLCIVPMQDYLQLDGQARVNEPSTLGNNWQWRMQKSQVNRHLLKKIKYLTEITGR